MPKIPSLSFLAIDEIYTPQIFERPDFPWKPEGDIFLAEAIEIVGRKKYKETWTGQELLARKLRGLPKKTDWGIKKIKQFSTAPAPLGSRTSAIYDDSNGVFAYHVTTVNGIEKTGSFDEAKKIWDREFPKVADEYERETQARERFEEIVSYLRTKLHAGHIVAHVINQSTGVTYAVPKDHWGKANIMDVFEMGGIAKRWTAPNITKFIRASYPIGQTFGYIWAEGSILLKENDVISLLKSKNSEKNFSAPANYDFHLQIYKAYHEAQKQRFINREIEWPSVGWQTEEKAIKEKMEQEHTGKIYSRSHFKTARKEVIEYLLPPAYPKTKKSAAHKEQLRRQLLNESV